MECKLSNYLFFYCPILYALKTRFFRRSKLGIIIWATEYLIPLLLAYYFIDCNGLGIISFVISVIAVYNFYEIGYIQNDCETIKKEQVPTLRLSYECLHFYELNKKFIYGIRIILGIIFTFNFLQQDIPIYCIIIMWLGIPFYMIYNYLRGRINLYLIFPLTIYRYCLPLFLSTIYYTSIFWITVSIIVVSYPLIKFIEICAGGKSLSQEKWTVIFLNSFDDRFLFRVKYYLFLYIISVSMLILLNCNISISIIPLYYFFIRIIQLKMPKLGHR